jgi:hypothetical protein
MGRKFARRARLAAYSGERCCFPFPGVPEEEAGADVESPRRSVAGFQRNVPVDYFSGGLSVADSASRLIFVIANLPIIT